MQSDFQGLVPGNSSAIESLHRPSKVQGGALAENRNDLVGPSGCDNVKAHADPKHINRIITRPGRWMEVLQSAITCDIEKRQKTHVFCWWFEDIADPLANGHHLVLTLELGTHFASYSP